MTWLLVSLAGAAGAVSRYGIALALGPRPFPLATLAVNVTGSFLLGLVLTSPVAGRLGPQSTTAVAVGFLGAYTTYSTFSVEALDLGRSGRTSAAVAYVAVSVVTGLLAAATGYRVGEGLQR